MDWPDCVAYATELDNTFPVGRPALVMEFFGSGGLLAPAAESLYDRFLSLLPDGEKLWSLGSTDHSYKAVNLKRDRRMRSIFSDAAQHGAYFSMKTASNFDCGAYSCELSLGPDEPLTNDSMFLAFPLTYADPRCLDDLAGLFRSLVSEYPFWGAVAGLGFDIVEGREFEQVAMPINFAVSSKRQGILVRDRLQSGQLLQPDVSGGPPSKRIPSVGWLTYIDDELVEQAGGMSGLSELSGGGVEVYGLDKGMLIRAGEAPPISIPPEPDRSQEPIVLVHRALRSLILDRWFLSYSLLGVCRETADAWLHRFE